MKKKKQRFASIGDTPSLRIFDAITGCTKKFFPSNKNESSDDFKNLGTLHKEGRIELAQH